MITTVAFDLETFLITRQRPAPIVVGMSWYDGDRGAVIPHGENLEAWITAKLKDTSVHLVGHNVAYDMKVICANYPHLTPLVFQAYVDGRITDTGIRQQLWDIAVGRAQGDDAVRGYSLAGLVRLIFERDITMWKDAPDAWRLRYGELHGVDFADWPDAAVEYPMIDAKETWAIWNEQRIKVGDLIMDDAFMAYGAFALDLMSANGMRTDAGAVAALESRNLEAMELLRPQLIAAGLVAQGGTKSNPKWVKKDKAARERMTRLCEAKGIKPYLTKAKAVAIDKAACYWVDDPLLHTRRKYALAEKLVNTYVPPLKAGAYGLPITSRFGMAATTRTTSSAPGKPAEGTNLQNSPRDGGVRECFIPRDGYLYLAADFSGAELHALAQVCLRLLGYSVLGDTLKAGRDVHLFVAAKLLGLEYDEAKRLKDSGDKRIKEARQHAKAANFGFAGAMGVPTFIKNQLKDGNRYTVQQAKELKATWLAAFPEMREYFDRCKMELGPRESAVVHLWPDGPLRKCRGLSTLCNTYFQALVARGAKAAAAAVVRECYAVRSPLNGSRPVNFVHDEVMLETPLADADTLAIRATHFVGVMEDTFNAFVPDYPTKVDPVMMRRWSKSAEPTYDSLGRLTVWEG